MPGSVSGEGRHITNRLHMGNWERGFRIFLSATYWGTNALSSLDSFDCAASQDTMSDFYSQGVHRWCQMCVKASRKRRCQGDKAPLRAYSMWKEFHSIP